MTTSVTSFELCSTTVAGRSDIPNASADAYSTNEHHAVDSARFAAVTTETALLHARTHSIFPPDL